MRCRASHLSVTRVQRGTNRGAGTARTRTKLRSFRLTFGRRGNAALPAWSGGTSYTSPSTQPGEFQGLV